MDDDTENLWAHSDAIQQVRIHYMLEEHFALVRAAARRYPRTYHDCVPKGLPRGRRLPSPLDGLRRFPVVAGHGAADGDAAFVVVGLNATNAPAPTVTLNDAVPSGAPSAIPNNAKYGPDRWTATAWRYPFPASAVRAGTNDVAVRKTPGNAPNTMISWVEITIGRQMSWACIGVENARIRHF